MIAVRAEDKNTTALVLFIIREIGACNTAKARIDEMNRIHGWNMKWEKRIIR